MFDEEGIYIENKSTRRKVPMREENSVYVIDMHVLYLTDTRDPVFVVTGK